MSVATARVHNLGYWIPSTKKFTLLVPLMLLGLRLLKERSPVFTHVAHGHVDPHIWWTTGLLPSWCWTEPSASTERNSGHWLCLCWNPSYTPSMTGLREMSFHENKVFYPPHSPMRASWNPYSRGATGTLTGNRERTPTLFSYNMTTVLFQKTFLLIH